MTGTSLMTGTHMQGQTMETKKTKAQPPGNYMADIDHICGSERKLQLVACGTVMCM